MKIKRGFVLRNMDRIHLVASSEDMPENCRKIFSLNETGAILWRVLEQGADKDALVAALVREYDVEEGVVLGDVEEFLRQLHEAGVLEQ